MPWHHLTLTLTLAQGDEEELAPAVESRSSPLDYTQQHGEKLRGIPLKAQGQAAQQELLGTGSASSSLVGGHWVAVASPRTDQSGNYLPLSPGVQERSSPAVTHPHC